MGINHSSNHKSKPSGGKKRLHCKKRNHAKGRAPSLTKLSSKNTVKPIRTRGGNTKQRALRLQTGNFAIKAFAKSFSSEIKAVIYHPSNNELVRMNMLTKSTIVKVDPTAFKSCVEDKIDEISRVDPLFYDRMINGNVYAKVTSRPGQVGQVDGYILEGEELKFYESKFLKKKKSSKIIDSGNADAVMA